MRIRMETQQNRSEKVIWLNSIDIPNNKLLHVGRLASYVRRTRSMFFFCFSMHVLSKWRRETVGCTFFGGAIVFLLLVIPKYIIYIYIYASDNNGLDRDFHHPSTNNASGV